MTTATGGKIHSAKQDVAFISRGFTNWKNATTAFKKHEDSKCHKEMITASLLSQQCGNISEIMSSELGKDKQKKREMHLVIIRAIRFLARQGLAFRGHEQAEGNLIQLLQMQSETNHDITIWLQRKQDKYLAPECQIENEILHLMAHSILRKIIATTHENVYFTIIADEVTDASNQEQFVLCFRSVSNLFEVHEDLIGLYSVDNITSATLT